MKKILILILFFGFTFNLIGQKNDNLIKCIPKYLSDSITFLNYVDFNLEKKIFSNDFIKKYRESSNPDFYDINYFCYYKFNGLIDTVFLNSFNYTTNEFDDIIRKFLGKIKIENNKSFEYENYKFLIYNFKINIKTRSLIITCISPKLLQSKGQRKTIYSQQYGEFDFMSVNANYQMSGRSSLILDCLPYLDSLANFIKRNEKYYYIIAVYTDYRGKDNTNLKLSANRAGRVKEYLTYNCKIDPTKIFDIGLGELYPKKVDTFINNQFNFLPINQILSEDYIKAFDDVEKQENAHQINRRTELIIIEKY